MPAIHEWLLAFDDLPVDAKGVPPFAEGEAAVGGRIFELLFVCLFVCLFVLRVCVCRF